jgi:Zn-dependent protease
MKTSYRLFSIFGIPIYLGWTVLLLPFISTFFFFDPDLAQGWWIPALAFSTIIPLSFAWHEFGHALMVRRFKKTVDFMELSVLGGTTKYSEGDLSSKQLSWVYAMGLVHTFGILALATIPYLLNWVAVPTEFKEEQTWDFFLHLTLFVNSFIFLFNLIPAQPYDLGKVVFYAMKHKRDEGYAQKWSIRLGTLSSIFFIGLGFYTGTFLFFFLSAILFFNSRVKMRVIRRSGNLEQAFQEFEEEKVRENEGEIAEDLIREPKVTLYTNEFVLRVQEYIRDAVEEVFVVLDPSKKPLGFVQKSGLLDPDQLNQRIETLMQPWAAPLEESFFLTKEFLVQEFNRINSPVFPVIRNGKMVGVVYQNDLNASS